jgi:ATPase subunit of ABC transporter with duplicated ATPase domains
MEDLLDGWPGTLIVVSHDRYLLERVTDNQYALLGDGRLRHLTGGVDQYLALRAASLSASTNNHPTSAAVDSEPASAAGSLQNASPQKPKLGGAQLRDAQKNLARVERALEKTSLEESALHQDMAVHDQNDFAGLAALAERQNTLNAKRAGLEVEWLETSELLA